MHYDGIFPLWLPIIPRVAYRELQQCLFHQCAAIPKLTVWGSNNFDCLINSNWYEIPTVNDVGISRLAFSDYPDYLCHVTSIHGLV